MRDESAAVRLLPIEDSVAQGGFIQQILRDPSVPDPLERVSVESLADAFGHLAGAPVSTSRSSTSSRPTPTA